MKDLEIRINPNVEFIFQNYPDLVRSKMLFLRELIIEAATEVDDIKYIEETLKWGEPSYLTKIGSTLRMDWKQKSPKQYALYFQCTSRLVKTFRSLFKNTLNFDGDRAIIFKMEEEIPIEVLKHCIKATLTYHKVKHLPTLGI